MPTDSRFVIVGGGLAAAKLAESLRDNDFDGAITLIGEEAQLPYERPPLSKEHLLGKKSLADFTVHTEQWYRDHEVELLLGTTVTAIDRSSKTVALPDGSTRPYDKLALATGSRSRRLPIPGADAEGVHMLRTIGQSDALISLFGSARRLVVVGAGWIGLEVTAAARTAGLEVTVLEVGAVPLQGALGEEMGAVFGELHRAHGVDLRCGVKAAEIVTADGKATGVRLDDDTVVDADAVLIAVGARPNIELAADAGLAVEGGVLVDESLASSDPDIVAVGDIADQQHPVLGQRVRVEHWATALNQPAVAALTMLDRPATYDRLPYFFTDQYDLGMEYTGFVAPGATTSVVVRGDTASREFVAFWLDQGNRVLAGMNVNVWDVTDRIKELILGGEPVNPDALADTSTTL
ncbi:MULTISPECIES: NAD(P)/FAD-dependent oxidoreductase [Nocardia]|uniref:NAD(P)/FAD-dependent oxidoreductase n=1 Tax=Nocardia TaxID=1817 RepID=UPI0007EA55D8|nr:MULTISPECIES: FAD-dependent oxidoreductase [Nocardia]OBF76327.1 pyridine nucleotide-disulfide oxidoreductase [Mycobacterium sp. 852002-51759_SCH5129042]MBF6273595.1 FAD-dependent oxidoreductase [Nocardia nova]OBA48002.1 pyridine nucleotide-disulfide oxidoreductase [Nocardia sp. 852002-51101_SCH5132738]OBB51577.1 pyridine nucleotide-disulfide oxidoreductase [Nocardia sp. 852002-51244_SCH5132740]PPI92158.1 FAD-dependent oxidoreductase [Nocardia nova]